MDQPFLVFAPVLANRANPAKVLVAQGVARAHGHAKPAKKPPQFADSQLSQAQQAFYRRGCVLATAALAAGE